MTLFIIGIICIIISIICIYVLKWYYGHRVQSFKDLSKEIAELQQRRSDLLDNYSELSKGIELLQQKDRELRDTIVVANANLNQLYHTIALKSDETNRIAENMQKVLQKAFQSYESFLETEYQLIEKEYDNEIQKLIASYNRKQDELLKDYETTSKILSDTFKDAVLECAASLAYEKEELEKIRATRTAATEALIREQEIKNQQSFYSLNPSTLDLQDIQMLEGLKDRLAKPRILSMLIWQTFYQKPMTQLCNNVLGAATVRGIYKITNQTNGMCYIGQAVDIATRWKDHAKCGLGIDTPAGNKLYKAMLTDGIYNFTWELLEKCSAEELNAKEAYYIELYDSYRYGYNSNTGVKK